MSNTCCFIISATNSCLMSIFFNNFRALTIFLCSANLLAQEPDFSKLEVQNDLAFLKSKLVSTHPNLFVYTTVPEFDHFFDSLGNSLPDRLNETEVFRVLTSTWLIRRVAV